MALSSKSGVFSEQIPVALLRHPSNPGLHFKPSNARACPRGSRLVARAAARRRWFEDSEDQGGRWQSEFGPFPWQRVDASNDADELSQQEEVTFVTLDGVVRLSSGSSTSSSRTPRLPRRDEADYMDPVQRLCLGAVFDIKALNGVGNGRAFCVDGFCRSVHMLSDVIADAVAVEGGEILVSRLSTRGGLNERLHLTVMMPYLWGVPPTRDVLQKAIHEGGGIVHRSFQQWEFL